MIGVKGSFWANQRTGPDIDSVVVNALLTNGSTCTMSRKPVVPSTVGDASPIATASQVRARTSSSTTPAAATHRTGSVVGRNPIGSATPMTSAMLTKVRIVAAST